jgi:hypothetical protein
LIVGARKQVDELIGKRGAQTGGGKPDLVHATELAPLGFSSAKRRLGRLGENTHALECTVPRRARERVRGSGRGRSRGQAMGETSGGGSMHVSDCERDGGPPCRSANVNKGVEAIAEDVQSIRCVVVQTMRRGRRVRAAPRCRRAEQPLDSNDSTTGTGSGALVREEVLGEVCAHRLDVGLGPASRAGHPRSVWASPRAKATLGPRRRPLWEPEAASSHRRAARLRP